MKKKFRYMENNQMIEKDVEIIPFRFIVAILLAVLETITIIGIVLVLCYYVPYFYLMVWATQIACVIRMIASDDNPDYKVPWLLFVLILPVAGFMLYFLFYSRMLKKKYVRRLEELKHHSYQKEDGDLFEKLEHENLTAHNQAKMICSIAETHLFQNTKQTYYPIGEEMFEALIEDLKQAEHFIFMEYFIIEEGKFWNTILEVLIQKAKQGVEVKVVYDDIGCMMTLPGSYYRKLRSFGIEATPFSMLKGNADSEFNNRSHRKITVIDGKVGYTGGVNIADEYINEIVKFGHWKDIAIRLEGDAVKELTKLFLIDYGLNVRHLPASLESYYPETNISDSGYMIPFGDGPSPIYRRRVGQCVIENLLNQATKYVMMMSPYLIVDNQMCQAIENAALRGVNVKIIVPHIPDKKLVFEMTRSYYQRFLEAGVEIYEYEPGFVHAKCYLADDETAMMGTINLDYRSLVHHFENGVWMYQCECIEQIRLDFKNTLSKSIKIEKDSIKSTLVQKLICSLVKIFSPML